MINDDDILEVCSMAADALAARPITRGVTTKSSADDDWSAWTPGQLAPVDPGSPQFALNIRNCPYVRVRFDREKQTVAVDRSVDGLAWLTDEFSMKP